MSELQLGFIGAGQMAQALARGIVAAGLVDGGCVTASDPVASALDAFASAVDGARCGTDNADVMRQSPIVFLCVKPQSVADVAEGLKPHIEPRHLIVSIVAGLTLDRLTKELGTERVIRVMPNTPCLIGKGAAGYAAASGTSEEDRKRTGELLEAVGLALPVDESLLDAVTGLSGSGPAYVFQIIEALSDGGVRMGLPRSISMKLAAQTVLGAAAMVIETGEHPAVLKDRVASPSGTTIAGLQELESHGLRAALIAAVEAATNRSTELATLH